MTKIFSAKFNFQWPLILELRGDNITIDFNKPVFSIIFE